MFRTKSKTEQARDKAGKKLQKANKRASKQAHHAQAQAAKHAGTTAAKAGAIAGAAGVALRDRVDRIAPVVGGAAVTARDKAVHGLDHGIDVAAPKLEHAVAGVGPKVDHARDAIVDDLLPRIQEMLNSVVVAKDDALSRRDGAVATVTGSPKKKRRRKGSVLIALGILSAVGAGVAAYLSKQQSKEDPWARPAAEPVDRPMGAPGVDAEVGAAAASGGAAAAGGVAAARGERTATPAAVDDADDAGVLSGERINELGSTHPADADDTAPGSQVDDTTGFGGSSRP